MKQKNVPAWNYNMHILPNLLNIRTLGIKFFTLPLSFLEQCKLCLSWFQNSQ